MRVFAVIWVLGLFTAVPYSVYYLLWHAEKDQYAVLIVFPFFWVFGYWGIVGPLVGAWRAHRLLRAIEHAGRNREQIMAAVERHEGEEVVIDLLASENRIPRFLARHIYRKFLAQVKEEHADDERRS